MMVYVFTLLVVLPETRQLLFIHSTISTPVANLVARCLYAVGIRKTDVFQNSSGYGMFTGGLGFQYGAERLGCLTVPAAAGNSKRQIKFINDFKTTALHAIPSYAIRLAEVFQEEGLDPKGTTLKTLVIGAEPHTDEQRRKIEKMLGVKAYNSFGMTEMNGPVLLSNVRNKTECTSGKTVIW